jgi:Cu2+-exporting ATPase
LRSAEEVIDDPLEWPAFGRALEGAQTGLWESQCVVEGMHCAACAQTVETALGRVPGIVSVSVSAVARRARVLWDPSRVQPSRWMAAAIPAGYTLLPANDATLRDRRRSQSRKMLWRWLVAGFCMMQVMMYAVPPYITRPGEISVDTLNLLHWAGWVLALPVIIFSCGPFFAGAWRSARQRRISMDLPVALGIAITFIVSSAATFNPAGLLGHEVYFDSLTMFVFFLLTGRWLEERLRDKTAGALEALMNRLPEGIVRLDADGRWRRVSLRRLAVGDRIRVLPGETFPADGRIVAGGTQVDESLLTGESRPVERLCGAPVLAGSRNLSGSIEVEIGQLGGDTRYGQLVALMDRAATQKPRWAQVVDRIAQPFLIVVLLAAVVAAAFWWRADPGHAMMIAVSVLIVTCPCALSLATPAAMLAAAGALARSGVMVTGLQALDAARGIDTVVFDKTGTLTRETPRLIQAHYAQRIDSARALALAAALAAHSHHPIARALVQARGMANGTAPAADFQLTGISEDAGGGLGGTWCASGQAPIPIRLGSAAFCNVSSLDCDGPQAHLSDATGWLASFSFAEDLRDDAVAAIAQLKADGKRVHLLSGDQEEAAARIGQKAGVDEARGGCLPETKLADVVRIQQSGRHVAMVGDGLNDGPVLAQSDVSFAFGAAVPLAQARADFVVVRDTLEAIPQTLKLAQRASRVVHQNLVWALLYNAACIPAAIVGALPPWLAGTGMAVSSLVVVLNAVRLAQPLPWSDSLSGTTSASLRP